MSDAGTAGGTGTAPVWHTGLDAEIIGHAQLKGWDMSDPGKAFTAAATAYRAAEAHVGAPPDQILRLPKDPTDVNGWRGVYERLGAPKEAKDYTFTGVEFDTPELTTKFTGAAAAEAHKLGLSKAQAEGMAQFMHKFVGAEGEASEAAYKNTLANQEIELAKSWGAKDGDDWKSNQFIAQQGAKWAGIKPETVAEMEKSLGYSEVMKLFHKIGMANKEDSFIANPGGGQNKVMTREMAVARYSELFGAAPGMMPLSGSGDTAWQKRYQEGGTSSAEFREVQSLLARINA